MADLHQTPLTDDDEMSRTANRPNPYQPPRAGEDSTDAPPGRKLTFLATLMLAAPFLLPIGSYYAYQPLNEAWTVKQFGCGCPPLDGSRRFNANDFNAILFTAIAGLSIWSWTASARRTFSQAVRPGAVGGGIVIILVVSLKMYAGTIWL